MPQIPRKEPLKAQTYATKVAKKGPFKNKSRRFSILSNSDDDTSGNSSDTSNSSGSGSDYDDHILLNKNRQQPMMNHEIAPSSGSDDNYSSSSDDENVDFVQLTKQRRLKAMKAVKGLKNQMTHTSSISPSTSPVVYEEEPELDDDLVDAVIEREERKMNNNDFEKSDTPNLNYTKSDVVDYSDELNDDLDDINFEISFEEENKNTPKREHLPNLVEKLKDEDIGEAVEDTSPISDQSKANRATETKIEIDVPKFNEQDVNSDDDYEFDNNELIQTLLKDNDDLELQNLDHSDDDFDYLIANQHKVNHNNVSNSNQKDISMETLDNTDDAYLMKEETQAMLDDFEKNPSKHFSLKNRRSSMYVQQAYNNENDLDDLDLDLLNNFEQFLPKQQAMRRRSSILNQTLLSSDDEESNNDSFKSIRKFTKKKVKDQSKIGSNNIHTKDIRKMLGISNSSSNFTLNFSSNAIVDSDDDTKLLEYIFEDSESETRSTVDQTYVDGNETDEDKSVPKKSTKAIGSKHAKEILSSSSDQFRAPKLGTFITKKPFCVVDGFTTRFLHPLVGNRQSMLQKAAAINKPDNNSSSNNLALDELINISEFDEDISNNEDHDTHVGDFFDDSKRIPLTAFRNKTSGTGDGIASGRFSFSDRVHKKRQHKLPKSKPKAKPVRSSNSSFREKDFSSKRGHNQHHGTVTSMMTTEDPVITRGGLIESLEENTLMTDSTGFEEVLLIGVESLPNVAEQLFDVPSLDFEIPHPHMTANRKRKSMSRSSKARFRRASMVEASAEGLRQTKGGLFDEHVMDDVEALLIDMGDTEDYEFLFGQTI